MRDFRSPSPSRLLHGWHTRSVVIAAVLVATLVVAATLAYQAQQAVRSHRATAENVLRDYAALASEELTRRAQRELYDVIATQITRLASSCDGRDRLPTIEQWVRVKDTWGADLAAVRSLFAISGEGSEIVTSGRPLPDAIHHALAEGLAEVKTGRLRTGRPLLRIDTDPESHVLVWRVPDPRTPGSSPIIGFVADVSFVQRPLERILAQGPLLPPSLGKDTRRLVAVRVRNTDGREIYASTSDWSGYISEKVLDAELGSLRLSVALHPSAAGTLIIGGVPRSRLPLLAGLTVLTAALVLIAIVQLRREHELARLRSDFISGVSHELRTPLAQIRMFGETLLLGRIRTAAEYERSLAIIVQESRRLTHLIENVLQFSRGDRGSPSVSLAQARVDTLLHDIMDGFAPLADSKRVSIRRRIGGGLTVPVDAGAFRQIMLNLLDNAVKYGPQGQTITVTARCEHGVAHIVVEDEGPGVPPEHVTRIWQPFYRMSRDAATGGTGIGLAIVKQLIALHDGKVSVESRESGGARFVVELPGASCALDVTDSPTAVAKA